MGNQIHDKRNLVVLRHVFLTRIALIVSVEGRLVVEQVGDGSFLGLHGLKVLVKDGIELFLNLILLDITIKKKS